jgi:hypothetical protein
MKCIPNYFCSLVNLGLQLDLLIQKIDHDPLTSFIEIFTVSIISISQKKHIKGRYFGPVDLFFIKPPPCE